ncbi:hypothetical protein ACFOTD_00300 [Cohnella sp. GCM10012308]
MEHVDDRYAFSLPGRKAVILRSAGLYAGGAAIFSLDGHAYVMLGAIGLTAVQENDRIVLSTLKDEEVADEL